MSDFGWIGVRMGQAKTVDSQAPSTDNGEQYTPEECSGLIWLENRHGGTEEIQNGEQTLIFWFYFKNIREISNIQAS